MQFFPFVYPSYSLDKAAVIKHKDEQQQDKKKNPQEMEQSQYKITNRQEARFRLSSQPFKLGFPNLEILDLKSK